MALHARSRPPAPVGPKFDADGSFRRYPGNTVICAIGADNPALAPLVAAQRALARAPWASHFAFLPPSSFHMTVFEGVCEAVRAPGHWPADLVDASLAEVTERFRERLTGVEAPDAIRMRVSRLASMDTRASSVRLLPWDEKEESRLRSFRDRLSERLGLRHAGHDAYAFHVTLSYLVRWPAPEAEAAIRADHARFGAALAEALPEIVLPAPDFCLFEDMARFDPVLPLGPQRA
ncbi:DUF1868 domain-containing protein [Chelatococcus sp. SYSU_G07232]|uniref:DUF1868 domain-containing protein n=1 Tax=Chelatococcus albus TaxID=3047466 RepID=A0ABT7ADH6_9HYPH|nr:DUF1868 domain-containing protein [Chelatococcus sp. SYSU_G07232]MDJ1157428.1 DUF1868 domain-containing protein [Chelatococcus sp. SYSU_G07232]